MSQIGHNRARVLFDHVLALERLQVDKDEAATDFNVRVGLAKEDGFDTNVVKAILKRRKNGDGQTMAFDELLRDYEDLIERVERDDPDSIPGVDAEAGDRLDR